MLLSSKNTRWSKKYHSRMIVQATPVIVHHACCIFRKLPCHHSSFFLYPKFFVLFLRLCYLIIYLLLLYKYYDLYCYLWLFYLFSTSTIAICDFLPLLYKYYCYLSWVRNLYYLLIPLLVVFASLISK